VRATITIVEWSYLTTATSKSSIEEQTISPDDFEWLCRLSASATKKHAAPFRRHGSISLQATNFVGVLEAPSGTIIEILPKHFEETASLGQTRALLCNMIQSAMDLPTKEIGEAHLSLFDAPLSEWVAKRFLDAFAHVVKRGIKFDYLRVEEEQRYLRGQLNMPAQLRQAPGRGAHFQIRHDVFTPDGPENRLLKTALKLVAERTQDQGNWRLAHELLSLVHELPISNRPAADFKRWRKERLMAHYDTVRPWCELILGRHMPLSVAGEWRGMSMLFPMEKLYERYVESGLRRAMSRDAVMVSQAASRFLCDYQDKGFFQLRPDMLMTQGERQWVLDAKWKRVNCADIENRFGLSQSDFYQLFAYGHKYLGGRGDLLLIYPATEDFSRALGPFVFSDAMRLWAVPFDLETKKLLLASDNLAPFLQP